MSQEARKAVQQWIAELGLRDPSGIAPAEYAQLRSLLSSNERPGFGIFLSMMMFERQQAVSQLINCNLASEEGKSTAAKLQGIVTAVDNLRDLVLNIADPIGEGSAPANEEQGVIFNG